MDSCPQERVGNTDSRKMTIKIDFIGSPVNVCTPGRAKPLVSSAHERFLMLERKHGHGLGFEL